MESDLKTISVGKSGVTEALVNEIKTRLRKHKKIKVKMLKSAREEKDRHEIADEVSKRVGARLLDVRGNTFILSKR